MSAGHGNGIRFGRTGQRFLVKISGNKTGCQVGGSVRNMVCGREMGVEPKWYGGERDTMRVVQG